LKILITGGLGNLGTSLISYLTNLKGIEIVVLDNYTSNKSKIAEKYSRKNNITFMNLELTKTGNDFLNNLNTDLVIHLANKISVDRHKKSSSSSSFQENHELTRFIADYCNKFGIPILYPSSTSIYHNSNGKVTEESIIIKTLTDYSRYKLLDEHYISSLSNLKFSILRLGSVHGYSDGMKFNTVVNRFCWQYSNGIPLSVWPGTLNVVKPYLSITDFVSVVAFIIDNMNFSGEIYNLVTKSFTTSEIIGSIEKSGGAKAKIEFEAIENNSLNSIFVSTAKIEGEGYKFQGSLEEDIKNTLLNLKSTHANL
jgi:nucleoside-diphosphate-sugar epimerase